MTTEGVRVRRGTLNDGGCMFCNRNIGPSGYINHAERVWVLTGDGGCQARFCDACMDTLLDWMGGLFPRPKSGKTKAKRRT